MSGLQQVAEARVPLNQQERRGTMNDEYELNERSLTHAKNFLIVDGNGHGGAINALERAQVYALVSIAESLHTLTKFLINKEEGTP